MKATIKNIEITASNEALVSFAQGIDFAELCEHAAALAKVECGFEQPMIVINWSGDILVNLASEDITKQTGAFAAILESCRIESFSSKVYSDKETGEPRCWVQLSLSYSHKGGGSNGMTLLSAWYSEREGWTFRDVK